MNELKQKMRSEDGQGNIPWWVWAIILAGGLSALVVWLLQRRAAQQQAFSLAAPPSPRLSLSKTHVESTMPVIQEIPLPTGKPALSSQAAPTDDLTIIEGIGPVISKALQQAGIATFVQLAKMDAARLQEILRNANLRLGDPTTWPEQAKLIAAGDWDGFHALINQLKGGRRMS